MKTIASIADTTTREDALGRSTRQATSDMVGVNERAAVSLSLEASGTHAGDSTQTNLYHELCASVYIDFCHLRGT